jgi:hypothetical protein
VENTYEQAAENRIFISFAEISKNSLKDCDFGVLSEYFVLSLF